MTTKTTSRIPMILTGLALKSLRDSGYTLAAALGEVIDNSIEASANNILMRLEEAKDRSGKKHIHRIIVSDDGKGMNPETLHRYLQLGFSTRYMSTKTIGKYGVGAKLAALNYCRQIDVWSRTNEEGPWLHVSFDLDTALEEEGGGQEIGIEPPTVEPISDQFASLLPGNSGTIVVWSKVDRLEEGRWATDANALRVDVEKELSRMFRYFLEGGIRIEVNETRLLPHDPLFLMEGTWADKVLTDQYAREEKNRDKRTHFPATRIAMKEPIKLNDSIATLTVTLYPREVVRKRGMGGDAFVKKLRVPENEGCISFVRLNREINYTNVPKIFPRGVSEPDRFVGIEVSFTPELDDYFGVRNVKRGVEPHDELRKQIRELLRRYVAEARAQLEEIWGDAAKKTRQHEGEHAGVIKAVKEVNRTLPKARAKGPESEAERTQLLEDLAKDVGKTSEEEKKEYLERIQDLPFVIESVDFPGTNFVDIQHVDGKVIIRLNTRHRFYRELWEPVHEIAELPPGTISGAEAAQTARRTIEALTLLIAAYGKAESMHENPRDQYGDLRAYWGQFMDSMLGKIKDVL